MNAYFIYCPQSGSRVLAARPTTECVVVKWQNGCVHVAGDLVSLRYWTKACSLEPGDGRCYWRNVAQEAARQVVEICGGVAEDHRGQLTLYVPRARAQRADHIMRLVRPYSDRSEDERNAAAGFREGAADIVFSERHEIAFQWRDSHSMDESPVEVSMEGEGREVVARSGCNFETIRYKDWYPDEVVGGVPKPEYRTHSGWDQMPEPRPVPVLDDQGVVPPTGR